MGCLVVMFGAFFPRLALLFIWLARPSRFGEAFDGQWLWPILGVIFLPFTTFNTVDPEHGRLGFTEVRTVRP